MEQKETPKKVTKSPGRIAAGKRLSEWNKQKKLNNQMKLKLQDNEEGKTFANEEGKTFDNEIQQQNISSLDYNFIIPSLLAVAGVGYILYRKMQVIKQPEELNKPVADKEESVAKQELSNKDPFYMA